MSKTIYVGPPCYCSFCGKGQKEVRTLITGPGAVHICDECVETCTQILEERGIDSRQARKLPERKS